MTWAAFLLTNKTLLIANLRLVKLVISMWILTDQNLLIRLYVNTFGKLSYSQYYLKIRLLNGRPEDAVTAERYRQNREKLMMCNKNSDNIFSNDLEIVTEVTVVLFLLTLLIKLLGRQQQHQLW